MFGAIYSHADCIACGIAEAYYKSIPEHITRFCDVRIDSTIKNTVREFIKQYKN